jgi:hypothetical protein
MQFAIIGLLIGATPFKVDDLSPKLQLWLRRGIIAVTVLALIISVYALSAVIYRTVNAELTLNRLTIIGWNLINIIILGALAYPMAKKPLVWHRGLQMVFSKGTIAYRTVVLWILAYL